MKIPQVFTLIQFLAYSAQKYKKIVLDYTDIPLIILAYTNDYVIL